MKNKKFKKWSKKQLISYIDWLQTYSNFQINMMKNPSIDIWMDAYNLEQSNDRNNKSKS